MRRIFDFIFSVNQTINEQVNVTCNDTPKIQKHNHKHIKITIPAYAIMY